MARRTTVNDPVQQPMLEDVLDAFVASADSQDSVSLAVWTQRYPQFEQELISFAASWTLMKNLPPSPDAESVSEDILVLRGMSVVQNLLHQHRRGEDLAPATVAAPVTSLLKEAHQCDLTPRQLAEFADLGEVLLRKLDRRLIRFRSIPAEAIGYLAAAIHRTVESVADYLRQEPTFAIAAQHRADRPPQLAQPEDFFDAVRGDPTMTDEQRARWLSLAPQDADR
jgi:hypothetical protein